MKTKHFLDVKTLVFLHLIIFFGFGHLLAQSPQLLSWNIAPNTVTFGNPPPALPVLPTVGTLPLGLDYTGESPLYMTNSISDASGNVSFFVIDGKIYDKDGYLIDNFVMPPTPTGYAVDGFSQEISIVPVPNSCTAYYLIFGIRITESSGGGISYYPVYTKLDMSLPNITDATRSGALQYFTPGQNLFVLGTLTPTTNIYTNATMHTRNLFGIAVTPYRNSSNDYLLFIYGNSGLVSHVVDASGINAPFAFPFGSDGSGLPLGFSGVSGNNENYTEMELVLAGGNYRVGKILGDRTICIADINPVTSLLVSGSEKYIILPTNVSTSFTKTAITGLEFSPDGQKVYYSSWNTIASTGTPVGYATIATSTSAPINFAGVASLTSCQIEMAYDGKMYFNGGAQLYSLATPNATPVSGSWSASALLPAGIYPYTQLLPDQMDGNIYSGGAAGNFFYSYTATTSTLFPTTTQTWTPTNNPFGGTMLNPVGTVTNPIIVLDELVIPPGYNITIRGMTFKFKARTITYVIGVATTHYGAKVIVKNSTTALAGGRLTLANLDEEPTVFTSDNVCTNGMWEGIEVWGNNALTQGNFAGSTAGKQGWLRLFSEATPAASTTISNAYIGAFAGKKQFAPFHSLLTNTGGGIIQAYSNTEFLNNQYGVYFMPYNFGTTNNLSTFNSMKFTTNTTFVSADNVVPISQAYLNDVKGIYFRTCAFLNDLSTSGYSQVYFTLSQINIGIKSNHSQFYCIPAIFGSTNGCTFTGLKYGIYATYTSNAKTFTVDYGKFTNNYRGVYLSAALLTPTVTRSNFEIMNYSHAVLNNRAYGLYLNGCNNYKVEGNSFTTYTGATTANNYGIIVNNSGPYANSIYRNTFDKVYTGIQAQNNNCALVGSPPNPKNDFGLQNRCNTFTIIKEMDMGITSGCIDFHQGTNGYPSGNNFSHSSNTAYNDYFTYSQTFPDAWIGYWYDSPLVRTPLQYTPMPAISITNTTIVNPATHCKTSFSSFRLTQLVSDLKNQINDYQTKIIDLKSLLDAGADQSLINAINSNMSAGDLKNLLMSKSPYLSDEVLIAYITKAGVPNGLLKDVVLANSPVTSDVKVQLNAISLPPGIRNEINASQTNTPSERQKAIDWVKYFQFEISILKNDIVRNYVNDSIVEIKIDTIISRVKEFEGIDVVSTIKTKEILADLYIEKQDFVNAENMLIAIEAEPSKQNLAKIKRVHKNLKQSNQTIYDLPSNIVEKQKVEDVASDNTAQGYEPAINILQEVFNQPYEEPIEELAAYSHSYIPMDENNISMQNDLAITCYPNPATESIAFVYNLQDDFASGNINIYNALGQIVKTISINNAELKSVVGISDLPNGLYFYTLVINNTTIANDKFVKSN